MGTVSKLLFLVFVIPLVVMRLYTPIFDSEVWIPLWAEVATELQAEAVKINRMKPGRKLMHNAEGVMIQERFIRENCQPISGEGLESENFSWSAAHYLLLLLDE